MSVDRAMLRWWLIGLAVAAATGAAAAGRTARGAAVAPGAAGGRMFEASVQRLGTAVPGNAKGGASFVDPHPIVLWAGERPAAVIQYRRNDSANPVRFAQELTVVPGSAAGPTGGFPFRYEKRVASEADEAAIEAMHAECMIAADVNGDGVDELVVARNTGGLDVVGLQQVLAHHGPGGTRYEPLAWQVARLEGRAVVHVLYAQRESAHARRGLREKLEGLVHKGAPPDPYQLLRVDGRGVTRIHLEGAGAAISAVYAVGAVNRPGSKEVDELVVVAARGGSELYVSRHRPDGKGIDTPRKVYTDVAAIAWQAWFVPQSATVVLMAVGSTAIHFIQAEKPVNWLRTVDLRAERADLAAEVPLGVAGGGADPRAILRLGDAIYAVDAEGRSWVPGGGGLVPRATPEPLLTVNPRNGPGSWSVQVVPSALQGDDFLLVHSRGQQIRRPANDDIARAADRFLDPEYVKRERRRFEPSLDDRDPLRDRLIAAEQEKRGIHGEIKTVEEWRRLLPESYEESRRDRQDALSSDLFVDLKAPLRFPDELGRSRDPEGWRAWLAALDVPAEVVFERVRRGSVVGALRVDAELGDMGGADLIRDPVDWRGGPGGEVLVTTLSRAASGGKAESGLYLVRPAAGAR